MAGQANAGVLSAWLAPNPDSVNGSAFGDLYCGALEAHFTMSLFGTSRDVALVKSTQTEMKDLVQQLGQAFLAAGACNGTAQPPPPPLPGAKPALATLAAVNLMHVSIKPWSSVTPSDTKWQQRPSLGTELHYGDTICFAGVGSLQLKWNDGTVVTLSDPSVITNRGKFSNCLEIGVQRPEDIVSPGLSATEPRSCWTRSRRQSLL